MARVDIKQRIQSSLEKFREETGYIRELIVSNPYYFYDDLNGHLSYPHSGGPGCYVFADGEGNVLKIGKENRRIGVRIWTPGGRKAKEGEESFPNAVGWFKNAGPDIAVWAIPVCDDHWWMAGALEGFLHEELLPDRVKKNRKI